MDGVGALVLVPTRELAVQVFEVLRHEGRLSGFVLITGTVLRLFVPSQILLGQQLVKAADLVAAAVLGGIDRLVGTAEGLLDPDTNLTYAVKYLAGAYRAAGGDHNRALDEAFARNTGLVR